MREIKLAYGRSFLDFQFDEGRFDVLGNAGQPPPLSDPEIGEAFDSPIGSERLEEIARPGESVLLVVPDATRSTAAGQVVNLVVRRLIANGTMPYDIRVIFATGIHRAVTKEEEKEIITPFISQRLKAIGHSPRDLMRLARFGETSGGIPIELNRALIEHDHVVIIGGVAFHYFAGFTGGRKLICPGLASIKTISETHRLAFDFEKLERRGGVLPGKLEGNPVNEAFMEAAGKISPSFAINTIVDPEGNAIKVFCGDWRASHRKACDHYLENYSIALAEKREVVVVSCGGEPFDINLIQAHKALDAAAAACKPGGSIIWLAECREGTGRDDFLEWAEIGSSRGIAERLREKYKVNGQTAWSLLKKTEDFNVVMLSSLEEKQMALFKIKKAKNIGEALALSAPGSKGLILPFGAKYLIRDSLFC